MKKTLLFGLLAAAILTAFSAIAAPVPAKLVWDASPTAGVTQYRVFSGTPGNSPVLLGVVSASSLLEFPISFDGNPQSYFVTAMNGFFESDPSNVVNAPTKPEAPRILRIIALP